VFKVVDEDLKGVRRTHHGKQGLGITNPANSSGRRCGVCVECRDHGTDRSVQGGTPVEAKPSEPDQDRAEEHQSGVVRFPVGLVFGVLLALAKDERVSKSRPARGDVDGPTSCEIQRGELHDLVIIHTKSR
jgi:hypothetical protein